MLRSPDASGAPRPRARLRNGALALLLGAGTAACKLPLPELDAGPEHDPPGTTRITWSAPTGAVSGLSAGEPTGRRVVYVHGTPGSAAMWGAYLTERPAGTEAVALDRPGFGMSEPRGAVSSLEAQARAIEPLLVERDGAWPVLVGHSLGVPVALRVACEHPDRVGGLLLLAGNADPELEELQWYNHLGRLAGPFLSRSWRNSNHELLPHRDELRAMEPLLPRITCPVVLLHGTEDELVPFENAAFLETALVGAERVELVRLEGDDHFFVFRDPELVRAALEELLVP